MEHNLAPFVAAFRKAERYARPRWWQVSRLSILDPCSFVRCKGHHPRIPDITWRWTWIIILATALVSLATHLISLVVELPLAMVVIPILVFIAFVYTGHLVGMYQRWLDHEYELEEHIHKHFLEAECLWQEAQTLKNGNEREIKPDRPSGIYFIERKNDS